MKRFALLFAAVAFALTFHASAFAQADRPHLSSDPGVRGAQALVEQGRFREALEVLRSLAPDHPDRTDIRFLIGLAALEAALRPASGDDGNTGPPAPRDVLLDEAVAAFHAILIERPGLVRVRLELARAFFLKREDDLAREQFERVLAGQPPPAVVANIRRFLEIMRARRQGSGYFGAALAPDSNVNSASDADMIFIGGLPFRRDADAGARSGVGVILWGGGEYWWPLNESLRLRSGIDLARHEYPGGDFDRLRLAGHVGPHWHIDSRTEAALLADANHRWAGGAPDNHGLGLRLEAERRLSRRLTAALRMSWHWHSYDRNSDIFDGPVADAALSGRWLATPTMRTELTLGYGRERPRSPVWRHAGPRVRASVSVALPHGFTIGVGAALRWTRYRGRWAPFTRDGAPRRDRVRTLQVLLLNRAFTMFGFSPQIVLVNETRKSNAQLYGYRRHRAELRFLRQF